MRHLTVRNVPDDLARALEREKRARGASLNQTVIDLLCLGLGIGKVQRRSNGLGKLAGSWEPEEARQFEEAVAVTEQIDEELWR